MRIGFGYDVHRFVENRSLILGAVEISYNKGLAGHSDADVLLHAICDALLGAAAAGDIGRHFPDTSPEFKNISSLKLLRRVFLLLNDKGFVVNNIDSTIVAQEPRLADYIPEMVKNIAEVLEVSKGAINIKATTSEGLGFTGRVEGISAYVAATITELKVKSEE
ncbi:MAG: 2-C-methyl-D-erythritol 2,4-cyclodiphosphate synthase [Nitrospinae bacterium RIFCSPLOWO2_02_39_17]|nr:MAG: 2-C-methyl-D-erythritol 2,4-cyclodiphosphate synthase [Nitrospinae bacterium RIFCSPHIGHO2_02_39_11]OGV99006.1 MAG: 2-C-methyl-D-erythritol 2,4-cyclodiphosphate synthase [Nitrospinae bacterium RIFCSPHIGHO2_12_FULL_39_42]OGW01956.1 MAG: 2-C-methyl-D-erythritol 2,4-cyclodiphosphate synthase [Nitrospinae bacterium RIFCSPLOWO2_02_39_17]OGW09725.1 MAG: 2-C-methyl-D-erythritol 2,4-cyclodiphosphate synthase [Nitrospinae bacterium RIFCSPLOWO2_12_FULL_39_93]